MKTFALALCLALCAPAALAQAPHDRTPAAYNAQAQPARTASATGQVRAIDAARGSITIAHAPVAALRWPAMVMPFAASAEQLAEVAVGEEVRFEFSFSAGEARLISIERR